MVPYMARTKFRTSKVIMNINNIVKTVSSNLSCHPSRVCGLKNRLTSVAIDAPIEVKSW